MMNLAAQRYHFEWLYRRTRGALGSSTDQKRALDHQVSSSNLAGFKIQARGRKVSVAWSSMAPKGKLEERGVERRRIHVGEVVIPRTKKVPERWLWRLLEG